MIQLSALSAEPLGDDRGDDDEDQPHEHLGRAGPLDHGEEAIEQERDDQDVEDVDEELGLQLDQVRGSMGVAVCAGFAPRSDGLGATTGALPASP